MVSLSSGNSYCIERESFTPLTSSVDGVVERLRRLPGGRQLVRNAQVGNPAHCKVFAGARAAYLPGVLLGSRGPIT